MIIVVYYPGNTGFPLKDAKIGQKLMKKYVGYQYGVIKNN